MGGWVGGGVKTPGGGGMFFSLSRCLEQQHAAELRRVLVKRGKMVHGRKPIPDSA